MCARLAESVHRQLNEENDILRSFTPPSLSRPGSYDNRTFTARQSTLLTACEIAYSYRETWHAMRPDASPVHLDSFCSSFLARNSLPVTPIETILSMNYDRQFRFSSNRFKYYSIFDTILRKSRQTRAIV